MDIAEVSHSGKSQVVRLPEGFQFEGTEVLIKKVGEAVVLLPYRGDWQALFDKYGDVFGGLHGVNRGS